MLKAGLKTFVKSLDYVEVFISPIRHSSYGTG